MDQEVYDAVLALLASLEDQNGVQGFAYHVALHYPDQARALLGLPAVLPEHDTMTVGEDTTHG